MKRLWGFGRRFYIGEDGIILPLLLVLLALGVLMIGPTLGHGFTNLQANRIVENRAEELYAADSGIEEGLYWLISGRETNLYWSWDDDEETGTRTPYVVNGATVAVNVEALPSMGENYYRIDSVATGPDGTTTVLSQVWAAPQVLEDFDDLGPHDTYDGDVYLEDDGTLQSHQQINGDVVATEDLTLNAQSGIDGSISVAGDFIQHSHTTVTGNICGGGNLTFKAQCTLEGDIYLELDDGESATIELQGQSTVGDIYIATTGSSASVTIHLNNKDEMGDVYVMPSVTLVQNFHPQATHGSIDENWSPDAEDLPPIDCPVLSGGGGVINTYEIS